MSEVSWAGWAPRRGDAAGGASAGGAGCEGGGVPGGAGSQGGAGLEAAAGSPTPPAACASALVEVCERARVRGRAREVLVLLAEGLAAAQVAERLGIAVGTVHVHAGRAKRKLRAAQQRHEALEFHRFVLEEGMRGPADCNPKAGLYRVTGPGEGERVRLGAGPLVRVEDLLRADPL